MNKTKLLTALGLLMLFLTGCKLNFSIIDYIKEEVNIDISNCVITKDQDNHNIFNVGEMIVEASCIYDKDNFKKQLKDFNTLPLSNNLQEIMYSEKINEKKSKYQLAVKNKIPEIKNGYYYFIDRTDKKNIRYTDEVILEKKHIKFTLILYDTDTNIIYYYEYDK